MKNRNLRRWLLLFLAAFVVTLLLLGSSRRQGSPETAVAQTAEIDPEGIERVIRVTGQGQVSAVPDMAVVRLGVQTEDETAAAALEANSLRMQGVISATREAGVVEDDIRTTGLRLQPQYDRSDDAAPNAVIGYRAQNSVQIRVRNLDDLGPLLDAAVSAGSNTIDSIRFEISDREAFLADARTNAMLDAIAKAEQLSSLAGAELGDVYTINDMSTPGPVFREEVSLDAAAGAAVPVQPGSQTIEMTVQVSWFLE